jgi:hypothetical protein
MPLIDDSLQSTTIKELLEETTGSGSGSGMPILMQRSIAQQVKKIKYFITNAQAYK